MINLTLAVAFAEMRHGGQIIDGGFPNGRRLRRVPGTLRRKTTEFIA
jgi:predicted sugar kinase